MKFKYTDHHLHSRWSDDIVDNGPLFEDYLSVAEENKINICFLEHYEIYQIEMFENHPFRVNSINKYLEELDKIKDNYEFVLSGLEVDYYHDKADQLGEFMDEYEKQLDPKGPRTELKCGEKGTYSSNAELVGKIVRQIVNIAEGKPHRQMFIGDWGGGMSVYKEPKQEVPKQILYD